MLSTTPSSRSPQPCYFSISPPSYNHFSTETPCYSPTFTETETPADPNNPFLAYREPHTLSPPTSPAAIDFSNFLQMQTAAAHGQSTSRPRPHPVQNVLHVTSDDYFGSDSSSSTDSNKSSLDLARCSRCQRTPSINATTSKNNMVQYGLNLWYCNRCASMVGLNR